MLLSSNSGVISLLAFSVFLNSLIMASNSYPSDLSSRLPSINTIPGNLNYLYTKVYKPYNRVPGWVLKQAFNFSATGDKTESISGFDHDEFKRMAMTCKVIYDEVARQRPNEVEPLLNKAGVQFDEGLAEITEVSLRRDVELLVNKREPVNIGMVRSYDEQALRRLFGYTRGGYAELYYDNNTYNQSRLPPNIAILCKASAHKKGATYPVPGSAQAPEYWFLSVVGYAFDNVQQIDYRYFIPKGRNKITDEKFAELLLKFSKVFDKVFTAALQTPEIKAVVLAKIGCGAFSRLFPDFEETIFWPALAASLNRFGSQLLDKRFLDGSKGPVSLYWMGTASDRAVVQAKFLSILKQNTTLLALMPPDNQTSFLGVWDPVAIGRALKPSVSTDEILVINAWDPWSVIGNGNTSDNSLDGFIGRSTPLGSLGWGKTNPWMRNIHSGNVVIDGVKVVAPNEITVPADILQENWLMDNFTDIDVKGVSE